jgi:hypothetical protein
MQQWGSTQGRGIRRERVREVEKSGRRRAALLLLSYEWLGGYWGEREVMGGELRLGTKLENSNNSCCKSCKSHGEDEQ